MKTSTKPTEYLLIKAMTNSEWDDCNFAIINIHKDWKQNQKKRLEAVKVVENDYDLKWLNYADTNVEFFKFSDEKYPEVKEWLSEKNQVFIELEKKDFKNYSFSNCFLYSSKLANTLSSNSGSLISLYCFKTSYKIWATRIRAVGLSSAGMAYQGACGLEVLLMASW